jgi:hypothetical protein
MIAETAENPGDLTLISYSGLKKRASQAKAIA